jgi:hypothetical protein
MRRASVLVLCIVALLLPALKVALAHNSDVHFYSSARWNWTSDHHTGWHITWRFAPNFPDGGPKKQRVIDAFSKWNALGERMNFGQLEDADHAYTLICWEEDQNYNGVFYGPIDGGGATSWLALTQKCRHSGSNNLHRFWIEVDSDQNWYSFDDPAGIGSGQHDLESVMAHEVGHATAWAGHYDRTAIPCSESPKHTMCQGTPTKNSSKRSLEEHDVHTFRDAY